jgi:serine-type D-Ala-D-Ala carboxypeptidase/endopeptidase (penicillin-binding protein 4)
MKIISTFFILFFITISFSQTKQELNQKIIELSSTDALRHGQWGVYAEYSDTGEEIISLNKNYSLAPASVLKVLTSSAALEILGEDYRFETIMYHDGEISAGGILNGNIYIAGGGDPTLGSNAVNGSLSLPELINFWIENLKRNKIEKIEGNIFADDFLFEGNAVPDYWPWIDMGNYYGAGTSALSINDNLYHLYFKPGKLEGDVAQPIRTEPAIDGLTFNNYMKTGKAGSGDNGYIYLAPGHYNGILRGTIPAGVNEFSIKGSIPNPPLFAAQYFRASLIEKGIEVTGKAEVLNNKVEYDETKKIVSVFSPPLKYIVYIVNKKSNNHYTEQLLMMLSAKKEGTATREKSLKYLKEFISGNNIPAGGLDLYDGSGLSRTNKITANMMGKLLSFMTKQKSFTSLYNSLGIAGDKDDISFFKNFGSGTSIEHNARIKSGSINGVRSHSGYIKNKNGRLISFSLIANNFSGRSSEINNIHVKVLEILAELE